MTMIHSSDWRRGALTCLVCCIALAMAGCSDRRSEQHRAEGDTWREKGRLDDARAAYEKAIESNPDNSMAVLGLARCSAIGGDIDDALSLFKEAIALNVSLEAAYGEAVSMLVGAERMEEALSLSEEYAGQEPQKGGALYGVILMKMGRTAEAITSLSGLAEAYPDSDAIRLDLGAAYLKGGREKEAEELFKSLLGGPTEVAVAARMGLIDVYRVQGRGEDLVNEFAALTALRPEDKGIKLGYARSLLLVERKEEAEAIAREVLEQDPESGWANYIVGYSKVEAGAYGEAEAFLEQAARALPGESDVKDLLAFAASGGAARPKDKPSSDAPQPAPMPAALPTTWQGLWKQAALNRLLDNRAEYLAEGGVPAREVLAVAALFVYEAKLAQEIAEGLPGDSKVRIFIDTFLAKDAPALAALFEGWKEEDPEALALRDNALGFSMIAGGSREQGLSVFLFCLERWPDHGVALYNIAQVFRRLGQPMIAAQNLQRLIAMYPENIDAHQMHYAALREGRAFEAARRAAEASYTLFPEERWSHLYLCQAYLDTGDPDLALQWLGRATKQFPNDPELESILARVLVRVGDCAKAKEVLEGVTTTAPMLLSTRATLLALCGVLGDDWAGAVAVARKVSPANRSDSLALVMAAGLVQAGDRDGARDALYSHDAERPVAGNYGKILSQALAGEEPSPLPEDETKWAATLGADPALFAAYAAVVALQTADFSDAAWGYYQGHLADRAPHIALVQLAFRSLGKSDAIEDAGTQARAVAESLSSDPRAWLGLSMVLKSLGDTEGEGEAVVKALETGPRSPEAIFRHAALMERDGKIDAAVADYRVLAEVVPESGAANNNLAYTLLLAGGKDEEALKYAQIAAEKIPNDAGVLHTLGLAQMRTGDLEGSRKNLKRAAEFDPANPTIMYDYGRLLAELGEKEEAHKRVRYALAMSKNAGLDFPQEAEAEAMLETLEP